MDVKTLSIEELTTHATERTAFAAGIAEAEAPTLEQIAEAEAAMAEADACTAEITERQEAATKGAEALAALKARFSTAPVEVEEPTAEVEASEEDEETEATEPETAQEENTVSAKGGRIATLSTKVERPKTAPTKSLVTITAAADVPDFSTGQDIDMEGVGRALVNRMKGFSAPSGNGESENLIQYGVAKFGLDFPEELTIKPHGDDLAVLSYAAKESRLDGGSLVAAGGWCAPSETLYDLCTTETTDGLVSVPEVNVTRGGIRFTKGPDFSTIYTSVGFLQTEAQAIAGTTKSCFEVTCPSFTDVRLDAIGLCIKAPILTNAAYPELVRRWIEGSMVAHAHKVNATTLTRMATLAGSAMTVTDFTSSAQSTLANLEYVADGLRQVYKLGLNESMEVILPYWVRGAIRSDLAFRLDQDRGAITDAMIQAEFAARRLNVQFVYDWQELADVTQEGYPATFNALIYPAGTFVRGTADVINLNAVYDAASLATNVYTGLFFEQGILVANTCMSAKLVTINVCNSGHTGAANAAVCGNLVP